MISLYKLWWLILLTTLFVMTFRTFVWIVVAVALWVFIWLKIHDNPGSLDEILGISWVLLKLLFKLLFYIWAILILWWSAWCLIFYSDSIPTWLLAVIVLWIIFWSIWYFLWLAIKDKWWFDNRIKYLKDKRIARKKRIANLKWEEKKRYEKEKRDWIIVIICLSIVFWPWIIMGILSMLWLIE